MAHGVELADIGAYVEKYSLDPPLLRTQRNDSLKFIGSLDPEQLERKVSEKTARFFVCEKLLGELEPVAMFSGTSSIGYLAILLEFQDHSKHLCVISAFEVRMPGVAAADRIYCRKYLRCILRRWLRCRWRWRCRNRCRGRLHEVDSLRIGPAEACSLGAVGLGSAFLLLCMREGYMLILEFEGKTGGGESKDFAAPFRRELGGRLHQMLHVGRRTDCLGQIWWLSL